MHFSNEKMTLDELVQCLCEQNLKMFVATVDPVWGFRDFSGVELGVIFKYLS